MKENTSKQKQWKAMQVALKSEGPAALLKARRSLYDLSQENRDFLHARFVGGEGSLDPFKQTIDEMHGRLGGHR